VVSIGIVAGAAAAGYWIRLETVNRAIVAGLVLGPLVAALAQIHTLGIAVIVLAGIGCCGGLFVVPLNALLQERGHELTGAGRALAVQNFFENLAMLVFVGLYTVSAARGTPPSSTAWHFGLLILASIGVLAAWRRRT